MTESSQKDDFFMVNSDRWASSKEQAIGVAGGLYLRQRESYLISLREALSGQIRRSIPATGLRRRSHGSKVGSHQSVFAVVIAQRKLEANFLDLGNFTLPGLTVGAAHYLKIMQMSQIRYYQGLQRYQVLGD
jgi:hypothetical protein